MSWELKRVASADVSSLVRRCAEPCQLIEDAMPAQLRTWLCLFQLLDAHFHTVLFFSGPCEPGKRKQTKLYVIARAGRAAVCSRWARHERHVYTIRKLDSYSVQPSCPAASRRRLLANATASCATSS